MEKTAASMKARYLLNAYGDNAISIALTEVENYAASLCRHSEERCAEDRIYLCDALEVLNEVRTLFIYGEKDEG